MTAWPHSVSSMSIAEILQAVKDPDWQTFRLSLKGLSTADKLKRLETYRNTHEGRVDEVRVDNYINALLRGGQLVHAQGTIRIQR